MAPALRHTVLIVDDEPEILESLRRTLRREPLRVLVASSPADAIRMLDEGGIDVLISDIDMPGMTGIELLAHAREKYPDVVRMLLTGAASMEGAIRAINEGEVHRFLTKPWDKAELVETLRSAVLRLDELRRGAAAEATVTLQARMLKELERAYPGIGAVPAEGETYAIARADLAAIAATVKAASARELVAALVEPPSGSGQSSERTVNDGPGARTREDVAQAETMIAAAHPAKKVGPA